MTATPPSVDRTDEPADGAAGQVQLTWWGHATLTVELDGVRVLTDPLLSGRLAHLRRIGGPNPGPDALRADLVVISHLHGDHLHLPSLRRLPPGIELVAPRGTGALLQRRCPELLDRLTEVAPGDQVHVAGLRVTAVAALHDGRRLPGSSYHGPALGYLIERAGRRVWFAGDTGLTDGMAELGPVDVALVPVGGWGPTLGEEHLDPAGAAEAVRRCGAPDAVPMHYGTFWPLGLRRVHPPLYRRLFLDPGHRFVEELARCCPSARAHVLASGQRVSILPVARDGS